MNARIASELTVTLPNRVGAAARVSECFSRANADLIAFCAYGGGNEATFLIVPRDVQLAKDALELAGLEFTEHEAVLVEAEHKPGGLAEAMAKIAEADVFMDYVYATADGRDPALVVLRAADSEKAIKALQ
jgi:hypothetical protein